MKRLIYLLIIILLLGLLSGCANFRKENPLKLKCPSCGYLWDLTPTEEY
jgi:hypothetical protein